jgi:TonB family protein
MAFPLRPTVAGLTCVALLASSTVAAQAPAPATGSSPDAGVVTGLVSDSAGIGIAGANLSLLGATTQTYTNADGIFRIQGVAQGDQRLVARRIGFRPETLTVAVPADRGVEVKVFLRAAALRVAPVIIAERGRVVGRMRGFHERRERGIGHFFTSEDIEKRHPRAVSELLRTLPGTRINYVNGQSVITFRGMRCPPLIWVDGAPATAGYLDPDLFAVTSLAGIEVYPGPATVPAELNWVRGKATCGVIAVWTKMPEARGRVTPRVSAETLAELIDSLRLYTSDNVDTPAASDSAHPIVPAYPDSLFRANIGGRVIVEFVVDINGRPDMGTFGAVLSTNSRLTEAVRQAVTVARFTPAWLGGKRVRQLIQLPFSFEPPGKANVGREPSPAFHPGHGDGGTARE